MTTGGCFCKQVRYEVTSEPVLQLMCFCRDCLAMSGTAGYAGYMVKEAQFRQTEGQTTVFVKMSKEGRSVKKHFCPTCGTNLWGVTEFGLISIAAGTLDDPEIFKPTKKVFEHDAPHWARVPDELESMS